jgi:hypothetical protein
MRVVWCVLFICNCCGLIREAIFTGGSLVDSFDTELINRGECLGPSFTNRHELQQKISVISEKDDGSGNTAE